MSQKRAKLLAAHQDYIARVKTDGGGVESARMPCCGKELEFHVPSDGSTWDSYMICPQCEALVYKIVSARTIRLRISAPGFAGVSNG